MESISLLWSDGPKKSEIRMIADLEDITKDEDGDIFIDGQLSTKIKAGILISTKHKCIKVLSWNPSNYVGVTEERYKYDSCKIEWKVA